MTGVTRPGVRILRRSLHSVLADADAFCNEVRDILAESGLQSEVFPVQMLLHESLTNAILHGNKSDISKLVEIEMHINKSGIVLRVKDQGGGFDWRSAGRTAPAVESTHGRGLSIYALYAKRTVFNDSGNQVTLVREIKENGV